MSSQVQDAVAARPKQPICRENGFEAYRPIVEKVDRAIEALLRVSKQLYEEPRDNTKAKSPGNLSLITKSLLQVRGTLRSDLFYLVFPGRMKNGKSTLVNALTGQRLKEIVGVAADQPPLPTDPLPATAKPTFVRYSDDVSVTAYRENGASPESWSLERFLNQSTIHGSGDTLRSTEEAAEFFSKYLYFDVDYPAEICSDGVVLVDVPGFDDTKERDIICRRTAMRCDAAVVVFKSDSLFSQTEMQFVKELREDGISKLFVVVNMRDATEITPRHKQLTWQKIVKPFYGLPDKSYKDDFDFAAHDVFFVNAKAAETARLSGDRELARQSGFESFFLKLSQFLRNERFPTKLATLSRRTQARAKRLVQLIHQREQAAKQQVREVRQLANKLERDLNDLAKTCDRDLTPVFERYRALASMTALASLEALLSSKDLPKVARNNVSLTGKPSQVADRTLKVLRKELQSTLVNWYSGSESKNKSLTGCLRPIFEMMVREVSQITDSLDARLESYRVGAPPKVSVDVRDEWLELPTFTDELPRRGFLEGLLKPLLGEGLVKPISFVELCLVDTAKYLYRTVASVFATGPAERGTTEKSGEDRLRQVRDTVAVKMQSKALPRLFADSREGVQASVDQLFEQFATSIKEAVKRRLDDEQLNARANLEAAVQGQEGKVAFLEKMRHAREDVQLAVEQLRLAVDEAHTP